MSTIRPSSDGLPDFEPASAAGLTSVASDGRPGTATLGVLKGEGVGPEVIDAALHVLDVLREHTALQVEVRYGGAIGADAEQESGHSLTPDVVAFCERLFDARGAVLCGPGGGRFVYDLRSRFDLYCKLTPLQPRPALADVCPICPDRVEGTDIVVVRENRGGLYFGKWGEETCPAGTRRAYQHCAYREDEVARIVRVALRLAQQQGGRLAVVTKPGGVPAISRLWREVLDELSAGLAVETRVLEVDNAVYQLIAHAQDFDVVVCPNMFGDVLSDCGSLLLSSRGMSYSGNFGPNGRAVYQTGHGAAWDLAGTDRANPIGQIHALAMMLRESFGLTSAAAAIGRAVDTVLAQGVRTPDIAGPGSRVVGTQQMGRYVGEALADQQLTEAV